MTTTTIQRPASMDEIAAEMDRRGEVIERLEAELAEARRQAEFYPQVAGENIRLQAGLDAAQARSVSRGKDLRKLRDRLILIRDEIADEGDRVYFGSTNHADEFRELVQALDDFAWDRIMEARDDRDVIERVAAEAEIARLKQDLAIRDGCGLKLLYEIREALGWNDKTSLSIMPAEIRRLRQTVADAKRLAENFEISGPDADRFVWLRFHGNGTSGRGAINLGESKHIVAKVALFLEEDRRAFLARVANHA